MHLLLRSALLLIAVCKATTLSHITTTYVDPYVLQGANATVNINLKNQFPLSKTLYGIFFEEIEHAGDGGLYAEMVQDRSFDAIAAATGFLSTINDNEEHLSSSSSSSRSPPPTRMPIDWSYLSSNFPSGTDSLSISRTTNQTFTSKQEVLRTRRQRQHTNINGRQANDITIAWSPLPGTQTVLNREIPLNPSNTVSMEMTVGPGVSQGGIVNTGYWGFNVDQGVSYTVTLWVRSPGDLATKLTVGLFNADLTQHLAEVAFNIESTSTSGNTVWQQFSGELVSDVTERDGRLVVMFTGPGTLIIDSVSVFPTLNVEKGKELGHMNPWPFRTDLLDAIKALNPGFLRFPGGCVVEGDWLRNRWAWKTTIGPNEARPGHYNLWGYWTTDGLGLFEFLVLSEELGTDSIWVVNNGVAHADSVPASQVWPMVEEALDSIEFILGPKESTWGSVRAAMGHPEPFPLFSLAIGNEDCGKPYYLENYLLFYGAISAKYPDITLISNCDMGPGAPTQMYDWHIYTTPMEMFNRRREFDGQMPPSDGGSANYVFASEYAVTDGGGWGNLIAAVSEAAFMTGMERNGRIVRMGAYAPLFVHFENRIWPTNMIVLNNHQWYGIPSYYVQQMFRAVQGVAYVDTTVVEDSTSAAHGEKIAASATCQDEACSIIALKIINFSSYDMTVSIGIDGMDSGMRVRKKGEITVLSGVHPEDENTFDEPDKISPKLGDLDKLSSSFNLPLAPYSVNVVMLHLEVPPSFAVA